ncbi:MAG: hypothetical protein ACC628_10285 [Pirellulaceae bacterium]
MRRRRFRKPAVKMSLFPFLAVLICTMGALIVLLVMVVQQARVYASHVSQDRFRERQEQDPRLAELQLQYDDQLWRRDIFKQQRSELTERLADRRLQLSHLEDHIRRLEREWKQLRQQGAEFDSITGARAEEYAVAQAEVERLRSVLEASRREFEEAKREAATRPRTFAIIPYKGSHGTDRRPIYIECTEQGIILQPEGVVLTAEDFAGPMGPGNPLDAALRTTREYLARAGETERHGEPYPLLIVRPDGVVAYAVARAAMKSWDDEFGYELVEADVELAYPSSDPRLRTELKRAIADARQRQTLLAAAMPSQFHEGSLNGFVATPTTGGFVRIGPDRLRSAGHGGGHERLGGAARRRGRTGGNANAGRREDAPQTTVAQEAAHYRQRQQAAAGTDGGQQGADGGQQGADGGQQGTGGGQPTPLASARGRDWGLPKATAHATGITRPIRVACLSDQLVILTERGDHHAPRIIPVSGNMVDSIDDFVSAIWQHMEQWGIAVAGGYWKPVLRVEVGHGAEARFREMRALLGDSGIEVTRKSP